MIVRENTEGLYSAWSLSPNRASQAPALIEKAVDAVLLEGRYKTYDLGGTSRTTEVGTTVARKMETLVA